SVYFLWGGAAGAAAAWVLAVAAGFEFGPFLDDEPFLQASSAPAIRMVHPTAVAPPPRVIMSSLPFLRAAAPVACTVHDWTVSFYD
ncbi:MAG: hypothetical protein OZ921_20925, partial [Sorangiineae bacterium]|nr:hypothetical protein [Sorangiineae bacterium]